MSDQQLTPTPATETRKMREQGVALTLFTGREIRLRAVHAGYFLKETKGVPESWLTFITQMFYAAMNGGDIHVLLDGFLKPRETVQEAADLLAAMGIVATKALVKPRVVETPQTDDEDEEIALSDLTPDELGWIFQLAFQSRTFLELLEQQGLHSILVPDDNPATESAPDAH